MLGGNAYRWATQYRYNDALLKRIDIVADQTTTFVGLVTKGLNICHTRIDGVVKAVNAHTKRISATEQALLQAAEEIATLRARISKLETRG